MATTQQKIAGLYAAFFNRAPDKAGFDDWVARLDAGETLNDIANAFSYHPTFAASYATMSNTEFVNAIYTNMLGSSADAEGLAYYVGKLNAAVNGYDQSDMVAEFIGGVLEADVSSKDLWPNLTQAEFDAAVARQNLMLNKVNVSINFMEKLGATTNVVDALHPETDPAYLASIKILSGITADSSTVTTANNLLDILSQDTNIAIATLNELTEVTDDTSIIEEAQQSVNTAPALSAMTAVSKSENVTLTAGTVVATAAATDADGQTLTYSLTGDSRFTINAQTGAISVIADTTFDYETETSVSLSVSVTDGIATSTTPLVINVTDVTPTYTLTPAAATAKDGDTVTFTFAANEDNGATTEVAYTITGVNAADVVGGASSLSGTATVVNGQASVSVTLLADINNSAKNVTASINGMTLTAATTVATETTTNVTINAVEIAQATAAIAKTAGDTGAVSYTVNSNHAASLDPTVVISGDANITVTSVSGNDTILIDGDGNNVVNAGTGTDTIIIEGTGNSVIVISDGAFTAGDSFTAGSGIDTIRVSGTNNLGNGTLNSIENLIIENDAVITMTEAKAVAFDSIIVNGTTAELVIENTAGTALTDLSNMSGNLAKLTLNHADVRVELSAAQIANITEVAGTGKISTSIDGAIAAANLTFSGGASSAATILINDTIDNIIARGSELTGVTITLTEAVDVAGAVEILASGLTVSYELVDTAANLAVAPQAVYNSATVVEVTTTANAAQAVEIDAMLDTAGIAAGNVGMNVSDTASMLANQDTGLAKATTVTATTSATVAEAIAIYTVNNDSVYAISDTDTAIQAAIAANTADLNAASSITISDAATVANVVAINAALAGAAGGLTKVANGYAINDSFVNISGAASAVTAAAGNITVSDANITVAHALSIEALTNTGTNSYVIEDAITTLLAANSSIVANASAVSTSTAAPTTAQMNALVTKYGTTKLNDANITVTDIASNLLNLSAGSIAEANAVSVTGTVTAEQLVDLKTLLAAKMPNVNVSDSAANLLAGIMDLNDSKASTISVTGIATIAEIGAINSGRWVNTIEVSSFTLSDTVANLVAAVANGGNNDDSQNNTLADATNIIVTDSATVAQINSINGVAGLVLGTTLTYSLSDSTTNVLAGGGTKTAATTISITDASVTGANATSLVALANFDGIYTIVDSVANISTTPTATDGVLNGAVSVTLKDSVANLEAAGGLTAIALDTVDNVIAQDTLTNLTNATTAKTNANAFVITNGHGASPITAANAAAVNALDALKPTTYTVIDAYADIVNVSEAITTMISNASSIIIDGDDNGTYDAISVAQFNTLDALTTATIATKVTDTIANLSATNAAAAITAAGTANVTISDTTATIAQISALTAYGLTVTSLNIVDTAANITAAGDTLLNSVNSITVSNNGSTTLSVDAASDVYDAKSVDIDGSSYGNYNITDTAANLAAADTGLLNFASSIIATDAATVAQATAFKVTKTSMGEVTYSLSDTAANLVAGVVLNGATNVSASTAATVAQAVIINAATNSGTTSYALTDSSANLATTTAANIAAIEAATGTVTASDSASAAQASNIAALTKAVVYSVSDTAADALAASTGLNEAVNVTLTVDTATVAEANIIMAATNSGTTTLNAVSGTAAQVKTLVLGSNDTITTVTVTGTTSASDATAIAALDTGANIGTLAINAISGTTAELLATTAAVLNLATTVTATTAMTLAQKTTLAGTVDVYSLADSYANLMENSDVAGDVDADAAITGATTVTITDASLTIAQAVTLLSVSNSPEYVYNIIDTDANIVAAMAASPTILSGAVSVKGFDGTAISFDTVNSVFSIVGTKADLDALSDVIQTANKVYEVSVADLAANEELYSSLNGTQTIRITDTNENLTSGNALIPTAAAIVVTDNLTVAQAQAMVAMGVTDVTYSISDTASALDAVDGVGSILDGAVNVTATNAVTFAQANSFDDEANSGTVTYSISDLDTNIGNSDAGSLNHATNITVTGTTGLTAANAQSVINATNSGTTTIAKVSDTAANLAAMTLGTNDTVTAITATGNSTVAQAVAIRALSSSVTYSLSDTAANLAAASTEVLNGAAAITATGNSTVAQATIVDAATASDANTSFGIVDTAAHVLAASATLLAKDANDAIVVNDTAVTAADATALRAFDTANSGFTINHGGAAGVFVISDEAANIIATANSAAVAASTTVTVTDTISTATALSVITALDGTIDTETLVINVSDTYANLATNQVAVTDIATNVTVTNTLNVAQAVLADGWTNSGTLIFTVTDTAAKIATDAAGANVVSDATSVTLTTAATVAQAGYLSEMTNLAAGYTISDTAANVQAALDTANAADAGDRDTVLSATAITLTTSATVAEACGVLSTESRGLYTVDGLSYTVTDSGVNIAAAVAGIDAAGITSATALYLDSTTGVSVANMTTLFALDNFVGHDHDANAATAARYYIEDTAVHVAVASNELIDNAYSVVANGTASNDTINLSMFTSGITINGLAGNDVITGTDGADVITGGADNDTFVFASGSGTTAVVDIITDFGTGADVIKTGVAGTVANYATGTSKTDFAGSLSAANTAMNGTVKYYFSYDLDGNTNGGNSYLFIDWDMDGTADQAIQLTGVDADITKDVITA